MAVAVLFLSIVLLGPLRPVAPAPVLNSSLSRHLRLHTAVPNQFDLKRDGISIRTASRSPPQWANLRMPLEQQPSTDEANATSAVNTVLSQIVKSSMSDMLQKLIKSVQEVLQRFMRDPDKRLPDFLQLNESDSHSGGSSNGTSGNRTSTMSEDQFWDLVFQRMMNINETNATTSSPPPQMTTAVQSIFWDSPLFSNTTFQLSLAEQEVEEKEDDKKEAEAPEILWEMTDRSSKTGPIELQVPPTPVYFVNASIEELEGPEFDRIGNNETVFSSVVAEISRSDQYDNQLPLNITSPITIATTLASTTESSSSSHFSTKVASGNPFELVIRVETNEGHAQINQDGQKSANMILPPPSTRRPPIPTSIDTLITGEPFNMAEQSKRKDRPESNIVVADWLQPSSPIYSSSNNPTSLLSTVLIGVSAGFIIFIVASFGLIYACYGGDAQNSRRKGGQLFCGSGGPMSFESGSCSDHRQGSPRDFGAAMVGPAPVPRRFLTRLNPCKPFYYQSSSSEQDGVSSIANDRHIDSTWAQASVLGDALPTFDTADGGSVNRAADLNDSVVF